MVELRRQFGGKTFHFARPVGKKRHRSNDERLGAFGAVQTPFLLQGGQGRDHLQGFPETHVVGDERAHPQIDVLHEPGEAAHLVGAKRRADGGRNGPVACVEHAALDALDDIRNGDFGTVERAHQDSTELFEVVGLLRLFQRRKELLDHRGVEVHKRPVQRNDLPLVLCESDEFVGIDRLVADRDAPVKVVEHVLRKVALRAGGHLGGTDARDQTRFHHAAKLRWHGSANTEVTQKRRRLIEEFRSLFGGERRRFLGVARQVVQLRAEASHDFKGLKGREFVLRPPPVRDELGKRDRLHGILPRCEREGRLCSARCARIFGRNPEGQPEAHRFAFFRIHSGQHHDRAEVEEVRSNHREEPAEDESGGFGGEHRIEARNVVPECKPLHETRARRETFRIRKAQKRGRRESEGRNRRTTRECEARFKARSGKLLQSARQEPPEPFERLQNLFGNGFDGGRKQGDNACDLRVVHDREHQNARHRPVKRIRQERLRDGEPRCDEVRGRDRNLTPRFVNGIELVRFKVREEEQGAQVPLERDGLAKRIDLAGGKKVLLLLVFGFADLRLFRLVVGREHDVARGLRRSCIVPGVDVAHRNAKARTFG